MSAVSVTPTGPGLVKCIKVKRDLLSEVARAYAFGAATLGDLETAAEELARAKDDLQRATGGQGR